MKLSHLPILVLFAPLILAEPLRLSISVLDDHKGVPDFSSKDLDCIGLIGVCLPPENLRCGEGNVRPSYSYFNTVRSADPETYRRKCATRIRYSPTSSLLRKQDFLIVLSRRASEYAPPVARKLTAHHHYLRLGHRSYQSPYSMRAWRTFGSRVSTVSMLTGFVTRQRNWSVAQGR